MSKHRKASNFQKNGNDANEGLLDDEPTQYEPDVSIRSHRRQNHQLRRNLGRVATGASIFMTGLFSAGAGALAVPTGEAFYAYINQDPVSTKVDSLVNTVLSDYNEAAAKHVGTAFASPDGKTVTVQLPFANTGRVTMSVTGNQVETGSNGLQPIIGSATEVSVSKSGPDGPYATTRYLRGLNGNWILENTNSAGRDEQKGTFTDPETNVSETRMIPAGDTLPLQISGQPDAKAALKQFNISDQLIRQATDEARDALLIAGQPAIPAPAQSVPPAAHNNVM